MSISFQKASNYFYTEEDFLIDGSIIRVIKDEKEREKLKEFISYIKFLIQYEQEIIDDINQKDEIREDEEEYRYDKDKIYNYHDTSIRKVLSNKVEATYFINKVLGLANTEHEIDSNMLELYESSIISKNYLNREADIVYKRKDMDVFFLIEHQSRIDYDMPIRIIEYSTGIITNYWRSCKNKKRDRLYPLVIPIVLYIGDKKWNIENHISERQVKMPGYNKEYGKYIVFDANNFSDKDLLENKGALSKIILLEKTKDEKELIDKYNKIRNDKLTEDERQVIIDYLCNVSSLKLKDEDIEKIRSKFKKGEVSMIAEIMIEKEKKAWLRGKKEGIEEGKKKGVKEGKREEKKNTKMQIARKLLESKVSIENIKKWTELSEKEVMDLKRIINKN